MLHKKYLMQQYPEMRLERLGAEVKHVQVFNLQDKIERLENQYGTLKYIDKITRAVDQGIDAFSSQIKAKQKQRYDKEYYFTPIANPS